MFFNDVPFTALFKSFTTHLDCGFFRIKLNNYLAVIVQLETTSACCWTGLCVPKKVFIMQICCCWCESLGSEYFLSLTGLEITTSHLPVGGGGFVNSLGTLAGNQPLFRAPATPKRGHHCNLFSVIWTTLEKFSGNLSSHQFQGF